MRVYRTMDVDGKIHQWLKDTGGSTLHWEYHIPDDNNEVRSIRIIIFGDELATMFQLRWKRSERNKGWS